MKNTTILGIGNLLLKDDGIGVHLVQHLEKLNYDTIYNVELIDGGTCILELLDVFARSEKVIVLDSLKGGHSPGTIYKLTPEQLGTYIRENTSLHDVQILDIIGDAKLLGYNPQVIIVGVEPAEITYDLELSPVISDRIPQIIEIIREELCL
ncbi:HyaD/HybD family hydrogenase maturation endopeptidase [Clostridium sp. CX1]|uniref:HyaD/HybD family hydrogenase maturation endopeptidase n=1 Tax=Clostridium sp. CX1 TaxID=2978346 RepID=UPI0021C100F8|nr:HyaD/HybD family hydrogenase maturation endopeptidase [Clostridium sp. CX1]MCT8976675.1 HyaD/HybD family hydrogenase maturation endopeptidase [Clostridium sp. CX1]